MADGQALRRKIEDGATAIVFSPSSRELCKLFPADFVNPDAKPPSNRPAATAPAEEKKPDIVEFADWATCAGTKLTEDLQPLDLKWWARKGDARAFIGNTSQRLKTGGKARELIRYIPSHSYIAREKVPEQYRVVLCELPLGKGRLWICDLALAESIEVEPIARIFADNLYRAAADPESTKNLPKVPSHEELLKGAAR